MGKRSSRDFLNAHQEWVDHMYNGPYWVNRISPASLAIWRWVRRHNRLVGSFYLALGLITLIAVGPALLATFDIRMVLVLGLIFFCGIGLWLQKPLQPETPAGPPPLMRHRHKRRQGTKED